MDKGIFCVTGVEGILFIDKWGKMGVVEVYFVWVGLGWVNGSD